MADSGLNLRKRQKAPFTPAHPYAAIKGGPCPLFLYNFPTLDYNYLNGRIKK
jgi:hypothetical protein